MASSSVEGCAALGNPAPLPENRECYHSPLGAGVLTPLGGVLVTNANNLDPCVASAIDSVHFKTSPH